jgi:hypothetical protein
VWIGALLIAVGLVGVTMRVLTYTDTKTVAQIGPFEVRHEEQRSVPIPELAGVMALVTGVCLLVLGAQSKP